MKTEITKTWKEFLPASKEWRQNENTDILSANLGARMENFFSDSEIKLFWTYNSICRKIINQV